MSWFLLALIAPAIDTVINFVDKYVIEHKLKDSHSMPVYSGIAALLFGTLAWSVFGMPTLSGRNGWILIMAGGLYMFASALYFHALAKSQTSYIVALIQIIPIFILILSYLLLDEPLTPLQLVGFILVFSAVMGLSIDKAQRRVKLTAAFYQIIAADLLFAMGAVIIKYTVDLEGFVPILAYMNWGIAVGAALLFLAFRRIRQAFIRPLKNVGLSTMIVMFLNESLATFSQAISFLAISLGPVALVGVLGGTQVFYAILYGVTLTLLFPHIFRENTSKKDVLGNVAMSIILFTGIWSIGAG